MTSAALTRTAVPAALLALLGWTLPAQAQTTILRGRVLDATTLEPLSGAEVTVVDRGAGVLTRPDGSFVIPGLEPGVVSVEVRFFGYRPALLSETVLQTSRSTYLEARLERQVFELEGIVVGAGAFRVPEAAPTSVQVLAAEELRRTPGGLMDVSRTLLSLPGVLGGVDNRNDLLVRGGGPSENAYYLDGIRIPQINHFATQGATGGALGLVNVDFIRETEFYSGAFPVKYGDALSSVLAIENRPGSVDGWKGDFTLGATEAGLTLDGPAGEKGNWLFSVRRSYLQFLFQALGLPIRPDYWDAQLRFELEPTARDRLLFVGLGAIDDFDIVPPEPDDDYENQEIFQRVIDNDQRSYTVGASWRHLVGGGYLLTTVSRSMSDFRFSDPDADGVPLLTNRSVETDTRVSVAGEFARGPNALAVGVEAVRSGLDSDVFQRATPGNTVAEDLRWDDSFHLWKTAAYAQGSVRLGGGRATVTGGLRADHVSLLTDGTELSPRGSLKVDVTPSFSLRAAGGLFHQTPGLISLAVERDGRRVNLDLPQQRNVQVAGGLAWQVSRGLRLTAEGFHKEYSRVPVLAADPRITLSNLGGDYGFIGAEPLTATGEGRARGLEIFAQQKLLGSAYFLGAYTLSWSEFAGEDGVLRPSAWDRRHALDLTGGYRLGEAWELGGKLRVLSGLATTPWDLDASAGEYALSGRGVLDWDRVGEVRTPGYARLDLRVERFFSLPGWNAVVYLDVQNVLKRENVVGYQYTENPEYPDRIRPIDGSTLLPTFGFSIEF
jgi:hypothetical protein